ncbi:uncharacterized protein LOC111247087 isoform X2 [Varroa destructor]|uniref:MPN domain-containing protein n=1 Tax=Varroa destructor TaxID=109461 RepID=A0A7M7JKL5_VARDE|nr:uncharacterized protein LOC111247087 isoform X2 [Varroa destructor]
MGQFDGVSLVRCFRVHQPGQSTVNASHNLIRRHHVAGHKSIYKFCRLFLDRYRYKGRKLELYKQEWLHRHKTARPSNMGNTITITTTATSAASLVNPLTSALAASTASPVAAAAVAAMATAAAAAAVGTGLPVSPPAPAAGLFNVASASGIGGVTLAAPTIEPTATSASAATSSTTIAPTTVTSMTLTATVTASPVTTVTSVAPAATIQDAKPLAAQNNIVAPTAAAAEGAAANDPTKPPEEEGKQAFEAMIRVGKTVIRKPRWFIEAKRRALGLPGEGQDDNKENGSRQGGSDGDCNGAALDKLPENPQYDPVTFASIERLQPFHISVSSNVLLLVDFHCHLSKTEVCGYLGGTWDVATHAMQITQAFPVKVPLDSADHAKVMEEIQLSMCSRNLYPVGWYHSHPRLSPHPTKRDVLKQLDYQLDMRGDNEAQYMPVIGLICSPQGAMDSLTEAELMLYWVMPPPENRPHEVGKAMKMVYAHNQDSFLTQDLLMEMRLLAEHYRNGNRLADFTASTTSSPPHTVWDQLKTSLSTKLPRDLQTTSNSNGQGGAGGASQDTAAQAVQHFWEFVRGLIIPNSILQQQQQQQMQQQQQLQHQQIQQQLQQQQQLIHQHHQIHAQPGTSKT